MGSVTPRTPASITPSPDDANAPPAPEGHPAPPQPGVPPPSESRWWTAFRWARWTLAFLVVAGALGITSYWIASDSRPVCDVSTISGSPLNETTRTCRLPDVTDYIYVLAVVGVLVLPEAKRIKIGGLEFERLTNEVRRQADEIARLSQQVTVIARNSQVLNFAFHAA